MLSAAELRWLYQRLAPYYDASLCAYYLAGFRIMHCRRLAVWLNRPFGVTLDYAERHPWVSVRRHLREVQFQELYFGAAYLSIGEAPETHPLSTHRRPFTA